MLLVLPSPPGRGRRPVPRVVVVLTNNLLLLVLLNFEEIFRFEARFSEVWKLLLILTNFSKEVWFNSALFVQARATGCLIHIQFVGESILWPYYLFSTDDGSSRMVSK
ncbi:hypothetical protein ZEAMMB73_Zm00001d052973, partial [Zea mays]